MSTKSKKNDNKSKDKKKKDTKKPKKEPKLKVYCGINEIPKRHRMGSMKECSDAGQIRYYGLHKIDKLVVKSSLKVSENEEKNLRVKLAGLKGTAMKLGGDYKKAKTEKEKNKLVEEYKITKRQIDNVWEKLEKIVEKQNKNKK